MEFQVGDRVVHPVYGVCLVKSVTQQRFVGEKTRTYYEVGTAGTTIWVPIDDEGTAPLRGIASKDSLTECRRVLGGNPAPFAENRQRRQLEIEIRLREGLLPALCEVVRDLRAQSRQRPLGRIEENLLKKSFKALCDEWAASDGVSGNAAQVEIESLLQGIRSGPVSKERWKMS